jgi:predicted Rossmann-fold nucleotide-binding protein
LKNAPDIAFVGTQMIRGIREHLFAVLRNAGVLRAREEPRLVVCWGGHAIEREEYDYSDVVGYALGLEGLDICTGCGAGAMKGPMKGLSLGMRSSAFARVAISA